MSNSNMGFTIALRSCIEGESFSTSGACVEWASPNFYSLATASTPSDCKDCQTNKMYCKGGSDIGPKPGYWRSAKTTDNFIQCLYTPACLGYEDKYNNSLGACFTGYQGILCADCQPGFSREGEAKCGKCPHPIWNIIRLTLVMMAVVLGIIFMIRSTLAGALQRKNIQSVYIKLLMNHLQLIVLTASFEFDWPDRVVKFFDTTEPVAQVSQQILSVDWFLDQRNSGGGAGNFIRLYYQKMIIYALLPILLALGCIAFWSLFFWKKRTGMEGKKSSRIMASLIILFFLVHPTIVEYMFSNFK